MALNENHKNENFSSDDDSSPRGVLETPVSGTESDISGNNSSSGHSISPLSSPTAVTAEAERVGGFDGYMPQWKTMFDVLTFKSVRKLTVLPLLSANHDVSKKGSTKKLARIRSAEDTIDIGAIPMKPSWRNFDYAELAAATDDFSSDFRFWTSKVAPRYLAPEYFMHGVVDEKTDVFAFGVLLLELITGRRAVDSDSRQSLVVWAKPLLETNNVKEITDPRLGEEYDPTEMNLVMVAASMCVHHVSSMRPYMDHVVKLLKGEAAIELKQSSGSSKSLLLEACDLEDYTCSNYLKDLNRHKQLLME
ncbi:unnamed protein product [Lupinus luteus]|uniref:Serine-threonine/tyrosine-protein kinase catalytic domain-containing protein n=1 Tax=Lupinus luteus TaxID=3873 RepID=A0AAV1WR70_LUPLU